jgi:hypothetical protein
VNFFKHYQLQQNFQTVPRFSYYRYMYGSLQLELGPLPGYRLRFGKGKHNLPDTIVTGPWILDNLVLVKFLIRQFISVVLPTLGGPTIETHIGGGSKGVRSTTGI